MEIIREQQNGKTPRRCKSGCRSKVNILIAGLIFIVIGVLLLLRNLGAIDPWFYHMLMSWQMLLIVLGVWLMFDRHLTSGIILAGVGVFFIIPMLAPVGCGWTATFWPFIFILIGIVVIVHLFRPRGRVTKREEPCHTTEESTEGFVDVDNSFGVVRHIVLDPVFEGARIRTRFCGTILDLKRTALAEGDTYVDVDMTFSGLEIHVPEGWAVIVDQVAMTMAGVDDKRYYPSATDTSRRLIIRGRMTLSGIEIKS